MVDSMVNRMVWGSFLIANQLVWQDLSSTMDKQGCETAERGEM